MNIYVVGAGGVGGYFGGLLAKARADVTFVCRGDHYEAIKENGLRVKSVTGDFVVKPAKVVDSIGKIKNPDLIIFTVKTYDTETVAKGLTSVINKDTPLVKAFDIVDDVLRDSVAGIVDLVAMPGIIKKTAVFK